MNKKKCAKLEFLRDMDWKKSVTFHLKRRFKEVWMEGTGREGVP